MSQAGLRRNRTNGRSADAPGRSVSSRNTVCLMPSYAAAASRDTTVSLGIYCTTSLHLMDQSLGPDAASERVLVRVARFCNWTRKLLCLCAGDQAAQAVAEGLACHR